MEKRAVQVDSTWYGRDYLSLQRILTHWHQANEIAEVTRPGARILEVGPGAGHTTWLLRSWGLEVTTLDFDESVRPDITADVTSIPVDSKSYDCVLAAEVLEHLPFEEFGTALTEMKRVSSGHVIITLPAPFVGLSALLNLPAIRPIKFSLGFPYCKPHKFDGQHYWDLGKWGFGRRRVRRAIRDCGLRIVKEFRPVPSLYCYFFVLSVA